MPTRKDYRLAELKCQNCGQEFASSVLHVSQGGAEGSEWTPWIVDRIDVSCPKFGSGVVEERNA
jgi:hypothetical protein